ncbi:MAG: hypothetical protein R6V85_04600 [Polyangia bacterium]
MDTIEDFEDLLEMLERHGARYLIVGGLAFIYHAKPRYTKDMDIWIEFTPDNVASANRALSEFGSPKLLDTERNDRVLQLGIAPDRIDLFLRMAPLDFENAWNGRVRDCYGRVEANWIGLEELLEIKSSIDKPRHAEDARVLREVKKRKN